MGELGKVTGVRGGRFRLCDDVCVSEKPPHRDKSMQRLYLKMLNEN